MMKCKPCVLALLALMLLIASPLTAVAQDTPPPLAELWVLVPKEEKSSEFFKGLKEHMAYREEHGDPRDWSVYTPVLGDQLNHVAVRYCCINWADVDGYRAWSKENEKIGEHFNKHVAPHVEKAMHYFERMSWENSHWSEANGPFKLFAVNEFYVKSGMSAQFDAARDKMSQIALNHGWASDDHVWAWSQTIGGPPQEAIIIPYKDFAAMDREGENFFSFLSRVMGSEEAAAELFKQFNDTVSSSSYHLWERNDDLSMGGD